MKRLLFVFFALLSALCGRVSGQTTGSLDLSFNGTGEVVYNRDQWDLYNDVKVQPDGKIVAVGSSISPGYATTVIEVTRYLPDGTFDPTFGTNGHYNYSAYTESNAYKCLIRADGKILIAGGTTNYAHYWMLLIQLNADGTPDQTFGNSGVSIYTMGPQENYLYSLALTTDGKILAAGYSQDASYNNIPVVLRYMATGDVDLSFGNNGVATVPVTEIDNAYSAISVQSDGKILAAGHISNGLNWFSLLITRFNTDGSLDATYGSGGIVNLNLNNVDDEFFDMKLNENNEAFLSGFSVIQVDTNFNYHGLLMKFDVSGQVVNSFGTNGSVITGDVPYTVGDALILQGDGKILMTGSTGDLQPANNDWALWRFNADGSADNTFGTNGLTTTDFFGGSDEALGIALYQDKIIVAGKIRNATDYLDFAVARYLNDYSVTVPEIQGLSNCTVFPNPVQPGGSVKLEYNLARSGNVSLGLVNCTGTTVYSLPVGNQAEGKHSCKITVPQGIAAGVYCLKISGPEFTSQTLKLLVTE